VKSQPNCRLSRYKGRKASRTSLPKAPNGTIMYEWHWARDIEAMRGNG